MGTPRSSVACSYREDMDERKGRCILSLIPFRLETLGVVPVLRSCFASSRLAISLFSGISHVVGSPHLRRDTEMLQKKGKGHGGPAADGR